MEELIKRIHKCSICSPYLALGPRPVFTASLKSKIVVIGQAPGKLVHQSGIPWDDQSGDNLRRWMGIDKNTFYDEKKIALIPMGFCYPGKGKTGDLPPRKECAPLWHESLMEKMKEIKLILLIGKYAQEYYLKEKSKRTLTETVRNYKQFLPHYFVLPHPSPRNNIWQAKNTWFAEELLPVLRQEINKILK